MLHLIPNMNDIKETLLLSERYGAAFEYNEFAMPAVLSDEARIKEIIAFYKGVDRDRSNDTMHGAFLDITIHSEDPDIRKASEHRVYQCMDIADTLGIRGVVFHTNTIPNFRNKPYLNNWLKMNEALFRTVTDKYPHISVFMENMFDEVPDDLAMIAEHMKDVDNFGVCFDYAHANVFGRKLSIETWAHMLMPYTKHMHINDNDGLIDQHAAVGQGSIDWDKFNELVGGYVRGNGSGAEANGEDGCVKLQDNGQKAVPAPSVLIETANLGNFKKSCEFMSEHGLYPFN